MSNHDNGKAMMSSGIVVVLGSLHYDIMVEASHRPVKGETVTGKRWFPKFGGKGGNQAVAAKLHGADVRFVSATGSDNFADYLHDRLAQVGILKDFIPRLPTVATGMSVAIQESDGDYGAVIVSGANLAIPEDLLTNESLWSGSSLLLLQNEVLESINIVAAKQAKARQIPVCLNAAPARQLSSELASLVDIIIVNAVEAESLGCGSVDSLSSAVNAASQLIERFPVAVVTAGGDGVAVCSTDDDPIALPAMDIDVISTHGAGDTFTGVLCAEIAMDTPLHRAVEIANEKAAMHVASSTEQ